MGDEDEVPIYVLTVTQIVGANVRAARKVREWSADRLSSELEKRGYWLHPQTIRRLERGAQPISVNELVIFGLALGVAPLVLLCPPAGATIALIEDVALLDNYSLLGIVPDPDDEDEWGEVLGAILVHGPWEREWGPGPDDPVSEEVRAIKAWERDLWNQAKNVSVPLSGQELASWKAAAPEWKLRQRLIKRLVPTLPDAIRRQLEATEGDWYASGIEAGWYLPTWTTDSLRKRAKEHGLSTR